MAPAAIRLLDLEYPLPDLRLHQSGSGRPYRSLMAVARLEGDPLGVAVLSVGPGGQISRGRLAQSLRLELEPELERAFARRASELPETLPRAGIPRLANGARARRKPQPPVSIVVATCCNPRALARCLKWISRSDYADFEVIVVENRPGCGATRRMLAERFPGEMNLRYLEEPRPGASHARNTGLAAARGEVVAFTDDDVVVDPRWIRESVRALDRADDVACVTGLILPLRLETATQLLLEQFAGFGKGFEGRTYRLPESREQDPLFPFTAGAIGSGASTVMRADVARALAGFDTTLGPGTPATGGEDLDLYIRILQAGHAVAYEPRAIVWHEHPTGMQRLRRQVYRYGIGLGAMLEKQLVAGPERLQLLRSVPEGLRYARDPESRKNAGKPPDYPARLTWLERLGMLVGPVAYLLSALIALARRIGAARRGPGSAPSRQVTSLALANGKSVPLLWFDAPAAAARTRRRAGLSAPAAAAALACVVASCVVALELPTALRLPAVLAFMCLAPGTALVTLARGRMEAGLVIGISLAAAGCVAQSMLWLGSWRPDVFLYALAAVSLLALAAGARMRPQEAGESAVGAARDAIDRLLRGARWHAALLAGVLVIWAASLLGADLGRMDGIGLLSALPPTYYLAFGLLLVGFARAATQRELSPGLLGMYVVVLVLVLHGTTALLYDEPRYAWTYKHLGVIGSIAASGHVDREVDIYNNWPAFFALNAWFSQLTGLKPLTYAGFAQLFFNLVNVAALRFALRGLTSNERLLWAAAFLFVLGNWVGQDYLAPQAFAFTVSLVVLGLCLRADLAVERARARRSGRLRARIGAVADAVLPPPEPPEASAPAPLGPRAAVAVGGLCFLAIVTSHQLSPIFVILSAAALWLVARRLPLWVPIAMAAVELWWLVLAWPFVRYHFTLIDVGSAGASAPGRNLDAALPGAALSFYGPAAVMALMFALAAAGAIRRLRAGQRDVAAACLIFAPIFGAGIQAYGGEGGYRAYLFALPWLAFFAAVACTGAAVPGRPAVLGERRLLAVCSALSACLMFAYFGQELANRIRPDDVKAATWYEEHAPPGSVRLTLAPVSPNRLTPRYPLVSLGDPAALLERPGFSGHRLGPRDLPRLRRVVAEQAPDPTFIVLSQGQEDYARLNGLLPAGSVSSLARALAGWPEVRLVYRRPTAWVFEWERTPRS